MADAAEVYRIDDLHQGIQGQVATDHPKQGAVGAAFDGRGNGDHQTTDSALVGSCDHRMAGTGCRVVPRPLARVVAIGHLRVGTLGEHASGMAQVGEEEVTGVGRLLDQPGQVLAGALLGDVLGQVFQYQDASGHPVLHAAGGQGARLLHGRLDVLADDVALQVVVVEGKQGKRQYHDATGTEQNLVAEFQVHVQRPW
ncbi:Uncharacterised protein [Pseudomonas putida]|nr:Uncharacterised protein [Pseudomonas putida]CAB5719355.1 Uncharacterised protein [Pseudomonas putida]